MLLAWTAACRTPEAEPPPAGPVPTEVTVPGDPLPPRSLPLVGGVAAADARFVVAADVEHDRVLVVDLDAEVTRTITLPAGWSPGRVALGAVAGVLLDGAGAVLVADPRTMETAAVPVCPEPRGVAVDGRDVWVACADGLLAQVAGGRVARSVTVVPDLGDLVLRGDHALVATRRAAEVLDVDLADGAIRARWTLPAPDTPDGRRWAPHALRRLVDTGDGRVAALYQAHTLDPIPLALSDEPVYGTGACDAAARPLVAWLDDDGPRASVRVDAVLPLDLAFWPEGDGAFTEPTPILGAQRVSGALPGASQPGVQVVYPPSGLAEPEVTCVPRTVALGADASVVGVGVIGDNRVFAVTRDPFAVETTDGALVEPTPGDDADLGLALFHAPSPSGVACATCHVEGRDDGHTWQFVELGARRTQSLAVPLGAPFHWDGSLPDLTALLHDTGEVRMGLPPADPDQVTALSAWLDALPRPVGAPQDEASSRGSILFRYLACDDCHVPPDYTDGNSEDVGTGGELQVPSLVGVGARLPLLHDGCADTLEERFDPACGGSMHGPPSIDPDDLADLVAYLATL